ncbi:hypothetical protein GTP58_24425 [Duganella sp. CY15W]|uniref:hypothetical protein n=1 Tax=Duganella sp. CY15W TaxID=2692172 RepID=UPI00136E6EB8|nr:hypothetical protein [Duganella sp. CY15W]MYM31484.1 hypothetical protein [Duganella sp. CY15W]
MSNEYPSTLISNLIASLDLNDYEDIPTGKLVLLDPKTKAPTSSFIELASPEHESRKRIDLARTRRLRAEFANNGKIQQTDPIDDFNEETDYLVAATLGWNLTQGGQPLSFSASAARTLYEDPKKKWLRAQALDGLNKTQLFIKDSAKS